MLVYQWDDGDLFCTEVMHGALRTSINTFKVSLEKVYRNHREGILSIKDKPEMIYVTGNNASNGNGVQKDCYGYLKTIKKKSKEG